MPLRPSAWRTSSYPILKGVTKTLRADKATASITGKQELALIGWSESAGRIVGHHYSRERFEDDFTARQLEYRVGYFAPLDKAMGPLPDPDTAPKMERAAQTQVRYMREHLPEHAAGGYLLTAHISGEQITVTRRGELSLPRDRATTNRA